VDLEVTRVKSRLCGLFSGRGPLVRNSRVEH
jgi:hypothetical protein